MNYIDAFHKEYLAQQGLEMTPKNIQEHRINDHRLERIYQNKDCWVVLCKADGRYFLNAIWKNPERDRETI